MGAESLPNGTLHNLNFPALYRQGMSSTDTARRSLPPPMTGDKHYAASPLKGSADRPPLTPLSAVFPSSQFTAMGGAANSHDAEPLLDSDLEDGQILEDELDEVVEEQEVLPFGAGKHVDAGSTDNTLRLVADARPGDGGSKHRHGRDLSATTKRSGGPGADAFDAKTIGAMSSVFSLPLSTKGEEEEERGEEEEEEEKRGGGGGGGGGPSSSSSSREEKDKKSTPSSSLDDHHHPRSSSASSNSSSSRNHLHNHLNLDHRRHRRELESHAPHTQHLVAAGAAAAAAAANTNRSLLTASHNNRSTLPAAVDPNLTTSSSPTSSLGLVNGQGIESLDPSHLLPFLQQRAAAASTSASSQGIPGNTPVIIINHHHYHSANSPSSTRSVVTAHIPAPTSPSTATPVGAASFQKPGRAIHLTPSNQQSLPSSSRGPSPLALGSGARYPIPIAPAVAAAGNLGHAFSSGYPAQGPAHPAAFDARQQRHRHLLQHLHFRQQQRQLAQWRADIAERQHQLQLQETQNSGSEQPKLGTIGGGQQEKDIHSKTGNQPTATSRTDANAQSHESVLIDLGQVQHHLEPEDPSEASELSDCIDIGETADKSEQSLGEQSEAMASPAGPHLASSPRSPVTSADFLAQQQRPFSNTMSPSLAAVAAAAALAASASPSMTLPTPISAALPNAAASPYTPTLSACTLAPVAVPAAPAAVATPVSDARDTPSPSLQAAAAAAAAIAAANAAAQSLVMPIQSSSTAGTPPHHLHPSSASGSPSKSAPRSFAKPPRKRQRGGGVAARSERTATPNNLDAGSQGGGGGAGGEGGSPSASPTGSAGGGAGGGGARGNSSTPGGAPPGESVSASGVSASVQRAFYHADQKASWR
ncbi:hypothetical protein HDU96_009546 [Phlyctochytrium bullatum]|nr:hypothetical protein HDU96_009546 [Phlyctochytrium bullatum]